MYVGARRRAQTHSVIYIRDDGFFYSKNMVLLQKSFVQKVKNAHMQHVFPPDVTKLTVEGPLVGLQVTTVFDATAGIVVKATGPKRGLKKLEFANTQTVAQVSYTGGDGYVTDSGGYPQTTFINRLICGGFKRAIMPAAPRVHITVPVGTELELDGQVGELTIDNTRGDLWLRTGEHAKCDIGVVKRATITTRPSTAVTVERVNELCAIDAAANSDVIVRGGKVQGLSLTMGHEAKVQFLGVAENTNSVGSQLGDRCKLVLAEVTENVRLKAGGATTISIDSGALGLLHVETGASCVLNAPMVMTTATELVLSDGSKARVNSAIKRLKAQMGVSSLLKIPNGGDHAQLLLVGGANSEIMYGGVAMTGEIRLGENATLQIRDINQDLDDPHHVVVSAPKASIRGL